jgi:hypothetical protein
LALLSACQKGGAGRATKGSIAIGGPTSINFFSRATITYNIAQAEVALREQDRLEKEQKTYVENLEVRPRDHLNSLRASFGTGGGIQLQLSYLRLYDLEVETALRYPRLAAQIMARKSIDQRSERYATNLDPALGSLRELAARVRNQRTIFSKNWDFISRLNLAADEPSQNETGVLLIPIITQLEANKLFLDSPSGCDFLGNLALASGNRELAYEYLYRGYVLDDRHLPIMESLTYVLWKLNMDGETALKYSRQG